MAIMSVREGLEFEAPIQSDTAALHALVQRMLRVSPRLRALRDPTRGGVATSLNEIADASRVGIAIEDRAVPVMPAVQSACEILGLDPLLVANEGKLIAIVPAEDADAVLHEMRRHPQGAQAVRIGTVVSEHPGLVVAKTALGANRVVPMPLGEQLPRIC
jgi:hydrogenase expression/formation protein HypE